jgi:type IV pilus assembly protein PilB
MDLTVDQLRKALVAPGDVTQEDFEKARTAKETSEVGIANVLISRGVLKEDVYGKRMAEFFGVPYVNFQRTHVPSEVIQLLPEAFARQHILLPVKAEKDKFVIATSNPTNLIERSLLEKYLRHPVEYVYSTPGDLKSHMYLFAKDPTKGLEAILARRSTDENVTDTTTIELVDAIIDYAYQGGASDIHIEPEDEYTKVRFRQDGMLHDIIDLPANLHDNVMTRLKVLAKLATDERRAAQDGKIRHKTKWGERVEVRLSLVPTTHAEKAVMRLLADRSRTYNLATLGFAEEDYKKVSDVIHRPWGMILVTGPTGSGKSTTLYSILTVLNKREVNITTIEDPVEFDMEGVNQIQVNEKTGLTFAKGLRSIVRQDPDVVMVGEIRDSETANIAVNAAMTGHLVLSTLHTNDSATAFPRLQDMGVEDFLIASTVNIVVAQRLVRKICPNCSTKVESDAIREKLIEENLFIKKSLQELTKKKATRSIEMYKGKGCGVCHQSGYHGRVGVFEVLIVDEPIREAIMAHKNADEIRELALKQGMTTMIYDGLRKMLAGVTTLEEILRVTNE